MSDDKKNGEGKIAHLIAKAKNRPKEAEKPSDQRGTPDDDLELEIDDPTREQATPPELNDPVEPEHDFQLDEDNEKKGSFIARMSMKQRILLVGIVGAVVVGANKTFTGGDGLDYLEEGANNPSAQVAQASGESASAQPESPSQVASDGFEPIEQGNIAPDSNALNLTGNPGDPEDEASNAFSLDPLDGSEEVTDVQPEPLDDPGELEDRVSGEETANAETGTNAGSNDQVTFGDSSFSPQQNQDSLPAEEDLMPPQDFGDASGDSAELQQLKTEIGSLNSELSSLSQSVLSIKEEMTGTASTNRQLANEVSRLMEALEERDKQLEDMKSRPDIGDLVIFRAANNCNSCVPHAYFTWNGKEIEVGDGLQWQGYDVAIRGDRMTLRNERDVYHYWYR